MRTPHKRKYKTGHTQKQRIPKTGHDFLTVHPQKLDTDMKQKPIIWTRCFTREPET